MRSQHNSELLTELSHRDAATRLPVFRAVIGATKDRIQTRILCVFARPHCRPHDAAEVVRPYTAGGAEFQTRWRLYAGAGGQAPQIVARPPNFAVPLTHCGPLIL